VKIVHEELTELLGSSDSRLAFSPRPPTTILLAGLQGAGKTTTAAKLARLLQERDRKRVLLASTDVRRPAAMLQLERLAGQVGAEYFPAESSTAPAAIARAALERARSGVFDVLIVDTAGRLHVDAELMAEVRDIDAAVGAAERLFVVDAMAGQDAVNAARAFGATLELTGIILTKADGDARGGAALSVRQITGQPIVFMGVGEKTEALEPFDPERMASRILGMGDVVSLVEQVHRQVDHDEAQRLAQKVVKGKGFDMLDLRSQLEQLQKMGGVGALIDKLPGAAVKKGAVSADQGDRQVRRQIAIINSMTRRERRNPGIIDGSRRRRIAAGSGVQVQDVNRLLKQFLEMQRVMKSMKGGRLRALMGALKGGMPPGFPGR
jgi:signal recognition particle subunit SRP54